MILFALEPFWNDFFTAGGFFVTLVGFGVTIWQLWETKKQAREAKSAADAAREAAERVANESRREFQKLVAAYAHQLATRVRELVENRDWAAAVQRTNDLADQLALLGPLNPDAAPMANELRIWAGQFAGRQRVKRPPTWTQDLHDKWGEFWRLLQGKIDRMRAPFTD
jgi:hypothetical protein